MANFLSSSLALSLLLSSLLSLSLSCSNDDLHGSRTFQSCLSLKPLNASIFWTHFPANGTASFAFQVQSDGWAAWGPNLNARGGMVGTQAFIARRNATSGLSFFPTSLTSKSIELSPGSISINFSELSAEYVDGKFIIYVQITVPGNGTSIGHTWQTGPIRPDGGLGAHPFSEDNIKSFGTLTLVNAPSAAPGGGTPSSTPVKNGAEMGRKIGFVSYVLLVAGIFLI